MAEEIVEGASVTPPGENQVEFAPHRKLERLARRGRYPKLLRSFSSEEKSVDESDNTSHNSTDKTWSPGPEESLSSYEYLHHSDTTTSQSRSYAEGVVNSGDVLVAGKKQPSRTEQPEKKEVSCRKWKLRSNRKLVNQVGI